MSRRPMTHVGRSRETGRSSAWSVFVGIVQRHLVWYCTLCLRGLAGAKARSGAASDTEGDNEGKERPGDKRVS